MKKAEEYLKDFITEPNFEQVEELIKQAQIDAIEEAVKMCAEKAELEQRDYRKNPIKVENYGQEVCSEWEGIYYGGDAKSILNCAEILKKEL